MDRIVGELFGRAIVELACLAIRAALQSATTSKTGHSTTPKPKSHYKSTPIPKPHHERAILIASSNISFGNACERLVNIAFSTSQNFPNMLSTYGDIVLYVQKELAKEYPNETFHVIISQNNHFGFSVTDDQYFAQIAQERYQLLIFSTKSDPKTKSDNHDANSQTCLLWN